jgi:hypothetical protein
VKISEMKKDIGRGLRLRPHVQRVDRYSTMLTSGNPVKDKMVLVDTDFYWYVDAVDEKASTITLTCRHTGHQIALGDDNIREYRTPDFLMLRCRLLLDEGAVRIEPV